MTRMGGMDTPHAIVPLKNPYELQHGHLFIYDDRHAFTIEVASSVRQGAY